MKILILGGEGDSAKFLFNALNEEFPISKVIIEKPVSKKQMVRRRMKRLGLFKVLDQLLFQLVLSRIVRYFSNARIQYIKDTYELNNHQLPRNKIHRVTSVNTRETRAIIQNSEPDLVLISGTRIVGKKTLACTEAKFINIHVGITPKYRGVHGGYWAIAKGDTVNCGVTVHQVDEGIDTGNVIAQDMIHYTSKDNFTTYPFLQIAIGIKLLKETLSTFQSKGYLPSKESPSLESNLYYHPTASGYLYRYIKNGVK